MKQLPLQNKETEAIKFIQDNEPTEGFYVGFSGGKDSIVLLDLVLKSKCKFQAFYSSTGIDPPEVVKFVREKYPFVKILHPKRSFFSEIRSKGYPTRLNRWCCDILKEQPSKHINLRHRLMGIRAEESAKRAKRPRIDIMTRPIKGTIYKPIFYWLEWEIWDYIESNNLPYPSLYDEGFERLGCVVCPFLCHGRESKKLSMFMERYPSIYHAFEVSMHKLFNDYLCVVNSRSGALNYRRETSFEEFIENWYDGK
jgi:phosphoadenosine phosphosulfate reductase